MWFCLLALGIVRSLMVYIAPSTVRPLTNIPTIISSLTLERFIFFSFPLFPNSLFAGFDYDFVKSFNNSANLTAGSLPNKARQRHRIVE